MAYIFHYQSTERVSDKDNAAITLYEYEMLYEFPDLWCPTHRILSPHSRQFLHQIDRVLKQGIQGCSAVDIDDVCVVSHRENTGVR